MVLETIVSTNSEITKVQRYLIFEFPFYKNTTTKLIYKHKIVRRSVKINSTSTLVSSERLDAHPHIVSRRIRVSRAAFLWKSRS
jgi:hypothetical protein